MSTPRLALLLTSALMAPSLALAQNNPAPGPAQPPTGENVGEPAPGQPPQEDIDVSIPGGGSEIVVTGVRAIRNIAKSSDQVVSVLSSAEIARTGEGNIAGALGRVTGLSVVGSGFVYVRGLGDRYSLALLNGSPLPSPEPLRRVVPLDIFPSEVISSSLVQKSYSVNFPGEFGGGVINLTTRAAPSEAFLSIGGGLSGDTETIGQFGYSYYGSKSDWTGFDNGNRDLVPALKTFFASGQTIDAYPENQTVAGQLVTRRNGVIQRWPNLPPNGTLTLTGGKSFDVGSATLGIIATAGYSSKFQNRDAIQQTTLDPGLGSLETDYRRITTDQRVVVNGLLGLGLDFGDDTIRWTNLYIRDTIKEARLAVGRNIGLSPTVDRMQQDTAWYERQLIDTQLVAEFAFTPELQLDLRAGYANSQREAPYELSFTYQRSNVPGDPYGDLFINRLNNGNNGDASISFSDLNEDLWSGGLDVTYKLTPGYSITVGGAYSNTTRTTENRGFKFQAPGAGLPNEIAVLRPDLLLLPDVINTFGIVLIDNTLGFPRVRAKLKNWAGYAKVNAQFTDEISLDAGVRYEKAKQTAVPIQVYNPPVGSITSTSLKRDYWLPAATLTWQLQPDMQVRVSGSKTIARPQFRELIYQPYFDPESNRQYLGNPLLIDSRLYNGEARLEWYPTSDDRVSIAGFYKKIKKPIEAFVFQLGGFYTTTYANAPDADLYGGEFELQKYFDLGSPGSSWLSDRRLLVVANYTYTHSKLKVSARDTTRVFGASSSLATDYFADGSPLTGQSDHIANGQIGLESSSHLSQQTILLSYASKRVVSRGLNGTIRQPDVLERPGFRLDFVAREGFVFYGQDLELKFEARNITGRRHEEYQATGTNRIEVNTYDIGRYFGLSAAIKL